MNSKITNQSLSHTKKKIRKQVQGIPVLDQCILHKHLNKSSPIYTINYEVKKVVRPLLGPRVNDSHAINPFFT